MDNTGISLVQEGQPLLQPQPITGIRVIAPANARPIVLRPGHVVNVSTRQPMIVRGTLAAFTPPIVRIAPRCGSNPTIRPNLGTNQAVLGLVTRYV